ncbi:MAG TPA: serine/threonine-protein kinase, partial [bacterium]|nr:serine/threonine-protein kinase [bacterium]
MARGSRLAGCRAAPPTAGVALNERGKHLTSISSVMDSLRWERIQKLFHEAAGLPEPEQRRYVEMQCAADPSLAAEVLAMLEQDARADFVLDREMAEVASNVVGDDLDLTQHRFGPYRIQRMLGEGGMGVVYLAAREDLQSRAAIKILRDAWLSPARRERFQSEQRMLAQLNHPSIARLYDADTLADGTPWFVMEYVEGVPLTEYCRTHVRSVPGRLELFRAVCAAVLYTHQHAVIHRDLKPSNVLVKSDGTVKLLDFGIAKQLESMERPAEQTHFALRAMTPAYAAPEQLSGERVGIQTDIYSLGVILYELLTGRLPFDVKDKTPLEAETIVCKTEAVKPSIAAHENHAQAPAATESKASWDDLDVLCLTALHKDPARRYATVDALIRDIDHYLCSEPLEARPDSAQYRLSKFLRRNWRPVTASAIGIAALIGIVIYYTLHLIDARNDAVAAAERTQRIQDFMANLFEGGDESAGPSESLRVVTLLERGAQEARALQDEPGIQAELYLTLGTIQQKMGNLDRADSLLTAALEQRKRLLGTHHPDYAQALLAMGLLRADQSQNEEAGRLIREGLEIAKKNQAKDPGAYAEATAALGIVLENEGSYDQAIELLTESARWHTKAGSSPQDRGAVVTQLANCHFYAGNYAASDSLNRQVLDIDRVAYGERHPNVASDLINLGAIQQEWGHYPEAEKVFREALQIYEGWYGKDHYEVAATLTMIGRTLIYQSRLAEASELLHRALAIRENVFGAEHPMVASTLNELARVAQQEGRLDEAEADFRRMGDIYKSVYDDKHYLIGVALSNLGSVYLDRKDYKQAEQLFREVVRRYHDSLSDDHLYMGITRVKLGRALLKQERYAEAEAESRAGYDILMAQKEPATVHL